VGRTTTLPEYGEAEEQGDQDSEDPNSTRRLEPRSARCKASKPRALWPIHKSMMAGSKMRGDAPERPDG
jgi:hypothetical protein